MAERDAGTTGRIFWPYVVALSIALVVLLVALYYTFPDVRQVISGLIDVSVSDTAPQQPEVEELVVIEPTAQVTKTPQPTNTTTPSPTPTATASPTNTPTNTPTVTPTSYPTPVGVVWTDYEIQVFVGYEAVPILYDPDLYNQFHCPEQGLDWGEDAVPFMKKYIGGIHYCLWYEVMDGIGVLVEDLDVVDQVLNGEIETIEDNKVDGSVGNYYWAGYTVDPGYHALPYYVYSLGIPEFEWCLFVEEHFDQYCDYLDNEELEDPDIILHELRVTVSHYGDPGKRPYCPNFNINSDWCQNNHCAVNVLLESE